MIKNSVSCYIINMAVVPDYSYTYGIFAKFYVLCIIYIGY